MANNKTGFIYYSVDTNRYQDIRIKRLKKETGATGIAVYDYILCEIYRVKGCFIQWDNSTVYDVADYFGVKETLVNEIVNYCCHVGLFDKALYASENILTSQSIQARFIDWSKKAKRTNIIIPEKLRIIPEKSPKLPEKSAKLQEDCRKVKESKEKKTSSNEEGEKPPPPEIEVSETLQPPHQHEPPLVKPFLTIEQLKANCLKDEIYFAAPAYQTGIPLGTLPDWLDAFNRFLAFTTDTMKQERDYRIHFMRWLVKVPNYRTLDPKKYQPMNGPQQAKQQQQQRQTPTHKSAQQILREREAYEQELLRQQQQQNGNRLQ